MQRKWSSTMLKWLNLQTQILSKMQIKLGTALRQNNVMLKQIEQALRRLKASRFDPNNLESFTQTHTWASKSKTLASLTTSPLTNFTLPLTLMRYFQL